MQKKEKQSIEFGGPGGRGAPRAPRLTRLESKGGEVRGWLFVLL